MIEVETPLEADVVAQKLPNGDFRVVKNRHGQTGTMPAPFFWNVARQSASVAFLHYP